MQKSWSFSLCYLTTDKYCEFWTLLLFIIFHISWIWGVPFYLAFSQIDPKKRKKIRELPKNEFVVTKFDVGSENWWLRQICLNLFFIPPSKKKKKLFFTSWTLAFFLVSPLQLVFYNFSITPHKSICKSIVLLTKIWRFCVLSMLQQLRYSWIFFLLMNSSPSSLMGYCSFIKSFFLS